MKNLGKIIIFLSFLVTTSFAEVWAKVSPDVIYSGDMVTYSLTLSGENIKKPTISNICGNNIVSTSSQTSIVMINGDYKKSYTLSYNFVPRKSCVIKPITVEINSKIEQSNVVEVKVKPMVQDVHANVLLTLTDSKKDVYIGETFDVTFILKYKKDMPLVDSKFIAPKFKGFWVKSESKPVTMNDGAYVVTKLAYRLAAQREGNATITPAQIKIATRVRGANNWGTFMPQVRWKTYYSNALIINAKALPNGVKLIGDFSIKAEPSSLELHANEAVNVVVSVQGEGNLEDIESFKPHIDGVNIFDEQIEIQGNLLTQKLAFVGDKNFTIPSFSLRYFNTKTKKIELIETKPINIVVKGSGAKKQKLEIQREEPQTVPIEKKVFLKDVNAQSISIVWLFVSLVVGIGIGVILMTLKSWKGLKREQKMNFKDEKLLLIKLLPYKEIDEDVKRVIQILEANLDSDKKETLNKREIKELFQRHDIF